MKELDDLVSTNAESFIKEFSYPPTLTASAPGRINIIGEHTDYNEGLSLAVAINRWVIVSIAAREDETVIVKSGNYNSSISFIAGQLLPGNEKWHRIVSGITKILKENHGLSKGFDAFVWGNVPLGSGVSSSAAIEVAFLNALRTLYQFDFDDTMLVQYAQQTEHQYLGVKTGLLDQYTSQFSRKDHLLLLDFQSLTHRYIPIHDQGYQWVLVNTMVKRELSGSNYSERVEETRAGYEMIQKKYPYVKHFRDIKEEHLDSVGQDILRKRILHYLQENKRVQHFIEALQSTGLESVGKYLSRSHQSLKENYEVSCEELDFLAEKAMLIPGCMGSRMMGGGFGGCTINLLAAEKVESFCAAILSVYKNTYGVVPEINIYKTVSGALTGNHYIERMKN